MTTAVPAPIAGREMIEYLTQVAHSPTGNTIKHRAHEILAVRAGEHIIDAGCGPGFDTVALAKLTGPSGRAIGVDRDTSMLEHARQLAAEHGVNAWTTFQHGSATGLPLPSQSAHAWYSERLLQHLPGTQALGALAEARRVLCQGGRLVVVDTDWGSLSIATRQLALERRLTRFHASRFASGYIGRVLPRLIHEAGFVRTHIECFTASLSPQSLDFVFEPTERAALAARLISPLELQLWRRDLADFRATGDAQATLTITLVGASKP